MHKKYATTYRPTHGYINVSTNMHTLAYEISNI